MTLAGKVALITGGSSGIGQWTALALLKQGASVYAPVRDLARGAELSRWLAEQGAPTNNLHLLERVDLSVQASVHTLIAEVHRRTSALHLLINNAGGFPHKRTNTADGIELATAVNHLAPFILTYGLIDLLKNADGARIVNVGSDAADRTKQIDVADLQLQQGWTVMRAYGRSKLALLLSTFEWANRLEGLNITANVVHPGAVATRIGDHTEGVMRLGWTLLKPFLLTPEQGAKTTIYAATSSVLRGVTGKYFKKASAVPANPLSGDRQLSAHLWSETERLCGISVPKHFSL